MADTSVLLDVVKTLASVAVPVVVAVVGHRLSRRLKLWEASQWRNQELIKARLQYYGQLAPMLNDVMCYLTFIGRWKELTPPEVIQIKRDMDRLFYSFAPLFSEEALDAYRDFSEACFQTHGGWGRDARIRSGFVRRRQARPDTWNPEWEDLFALSENEEVSQQNLTSVLDRYDRLLAALVKDIELSEPRTRYSISPRLANVR
jgi:PAS domain-containing protein